MPIVKIENINKAFSWGLWKIDETVDFLLHSSTLSDEETESFGSISHEIRQKEWLAARLALKIILQENGYTYRGLIKDKVNKPYPIFLPIHISLAHKFPYAVAIFNKNSPCGIDIEKPKSSLLRVCNKYLSSNELLYIKSDPGNLCLSWAAKEVLYKIYGKKKVSFKSHMFLYPFELQDQGEIKATIKLKDFKEDFTLAYSHFDGFYICYNI